VISRARRRRQICVICRLTVISVAVSAVVDRGWHRSCRLTPVRVGFAWLVWLAGCGFHGTEVTSRDAGGSDAIPPDMAPPGRTRAGLIGLWSFDELDGTTMNDTSDAAPRVPLMVTAPGMVTFAAGTMTPNGIVVIASAAAPHLDRDVKNAGAVTLEAWVKPAVGQQGAAGQPAVVAGLDASVVSRNIALLQDGMRWVGRVRTTPDVNGGPDLTSTADVSAGAMTHVAVVADATQRILYVNGRPDFVDPAPAPLFSWDMSYRMVLGNEPTPNRPWSGTFALVAIYARALSAAEIQINFTAGPDAP